MIAIKWIIHNNHSKGTFNLMTLWIPVVFIFASYVSIYYNKKCTEPYLVLTLLRMSTETKHSCSGGLQAFLRLGDVDFLHFGDWGWTLMLDVEEEGWLSTYLSFHFSAPCPH